MNPQSPAPQFGSGTPLLGQGGGVSPQLQAELQAVQTGQAGATAMQTPNSAGFDPQTAQPVPGQGPAPQAQMAQSQQPPEDPAGKEVALILNTLINRLKLHTDTAKAQMGIA